MSIPTYISKSKAVEIIAERTKSKEKPRGDSLRTWKNKISGRIQTRINNKEIYKKESGELLSGTIRSSLESVFPDCFSDWPCLRIGDTVLTLRQIVSEPKKIHYPENIDDCYKLIKTLYEEIDQLKEEIEQLQPDAKRYRTNRLKLMKKKNQ